MENHNTEKEKKSPRFGVLDAMIILLVVCLIVGIYFRSNIIERFQAIRNVGDYTVTFAVDDIRYTTPHYVNVGDKLVFAEDGKEFGALIEASEGASDMALKVTPAVKTFTDNGQVIEVFYPNNESRVDATGRVHCRGTYSEDGGFLVNGSTYLSAGQTVQVRTELVAFNLRVLEITPAE